MGKVKNTTEVSAAKMARHEARCEKKKAKTAVFKHDEMETARIEKAKRKIEKAKLFKAKRKMEEAKMIETKLSMNEAKREMDKVLYMKYQSRTNLGVASTASDEHRLGQS